MIGTNDLKFQKSSLNIILTIKINAERIKQINENLYIYVFKESIKVYDCKTFEMKADLKLPLIRKEPMLDPMLDILDNEILIYMAEKKLYFYKINIAENKLVFMHYLSNICNFVYLSKRKEIFLLIESSCPNLKYCPNLKKRYEMAKCDLMGNIIFTNKITPKIIHQCVELVDFEKIYKNVSGFREDSRGFIAFYGLCNEKYIINICGYCDQWYDIEPNWEIKSEINIYNVDDLKEILDKEYEYYLDYFKIGDNLFKFKKTKSFFFYNEKDNKIEYFNNIFNYLNNITDDELKWCYEEEIRENHMQKYFYLSDKLFAFLDKGNNLYVVDISNENKIVRKIESLWNEKEYFIKDIDILYNEKKDKEENLYILFKDIRYRYLIGEEREGKIIHGIIEK